MKKKFVKLHNYFKNLSRALSAIITPHMFIYNGQWLVNRIVVYKFYIMPAAIINITATCAYASLLYTVCSYATVFVIFFT